MSIKIISAGLLAAALSFAAGNSSANPVVEVEPDNAVIAPAAPPVDIVETPGPAPSPAHFWVHGHWRWASNHYAWRRGGWFKRRAGSTWNSGHWARGNRGWAWHRGAWRRG
jgi:hypothetical protein